MKKYLSILSMLTIISPAFAECCDTPAYNVFFGDKINSFTVYVAQSTGPGTLFKLINPAIWEIYPQTFAMIQYSQPITFFRLDSRLNLNVGQNYAYDTSGGLSFTGVGISIDTAILQYKGWYTGIGIGPFMRDSRDRWVESRLVFEEKFFIGKNINERWNVEFTTIHFSNGNFTAANEGYNYVGFGFGYKF